MLVAGLEAIASRAMGAIASRLEAERCLLFCMLVDWLVV